MPIRCALVLAMVLAGLAPVGAAAQPSGGNPNFVGVCRYSHQLPDDPIVYPGGPGASHLHDFFANTTTNASSTYASLRAGRTTCRKPAETAAYWVPSMFDDGVRVQPTHVRAYYTTGGKHPASVKAFPAGLEIIASEQRAASFACVGGEEQGRGQRTMPTCPSGSHLVVRIAFPDCWDGKNLDSADHRGHMAYSARSPRLRSAQRGASATDRRARANVCPSSHPVPVPRLSANVHYPSDGGNVTFAASAQPHADFVNAWEQATLERLVRECLNARVHCGVSRR